MTALFLALFLAVAPGDHAAPAATSADVHGGQAPTAAIGPDGRLWVAFGAGDHVYVTHAANLEAAFAPPVVVNTEPQNIRFHGENRPALAVDAKGRIHVLYTRALPQRFSGHLMYARSLDGGKSFETPRRINDDTEITGHSFGALTAVGDRVTLAWIDGRDRLAAAAAGDETFIGSSLYGAVSTDGGAHFAPNRALAPGMCQCCRLAMTPDAAGLPVLVWRHIFGDHVRDHAMGAFAADGSFRHARLTHDQWRIEGCPHQGPALAVAPDGARHVAWWTVRDDESVLYYGIAAPDGSWRRPPRVLQAGDGMHPALTLLGARVYLVWLDQDGETTRLQATWSEDGGASFAPTAVVDTAQGAADHPALLRAGDTVVRAWQRDGRYVRARWTEPMR